MSSVTDEKGEIAMRSQPIDLGGTLIHRRGTLIGKALEPLEKGVGEILVRFSLQYLVDTEVVWSR